jgi:cytochrome c oxidase subunit I+III
MTRRALDVSALPTHAFGTRATLWWGVLAMLAIEGAALAIAVAALLYVRQNFAAWPPSGTSPPDLVAATTNTALLLLSVVPMWVVSRAARGMRRVPLALSLGVMTLIGVASCTLRGFELAGLNCRWDGNAYGSAVWLVIGMHTLHLLGATIENLLLLAVVLGPVEPRHYVDAESNALYWYFIVGAWIPVYVLVYLWPRFA